MINVYVTSFSCGIIALHMTSESSASVVARYYYYGIHSFRRLPGALQSIVDGSGADMMVALRKSGLFTDCDNGENEGRVLANNCVARRLE